MAAFEEEAEEGEEEEKHPACPPHGSS